MKGSYSKTSIGKQLRWKNPLGSDSRHSSGQNGQIRWAFTKSYRNKALFSPMCYTLASASGDVEAPGWEGEISAIGAHRLFDKNRQSQVWVADHFMCFLDLLRPTCPPGLGRLLDGQPDPECHCLNATTTVWPAAWTPLSPPKQGFLAQIWLDQTHKGYDVPCTSGLRISIALSATDQASLASSQRDWIS